MKRPKPRRPSHAERAFRDAVRDILESEGWFEVEVEDPPPRGWKLPLATA
jgi:hypothetical protein